MKQTIGWKYSMNFGILMEILMSEGAPLSEPSSSSEMARILQDVQEVSIHGKFPDGASVIHRLRGEDPVAVVIREPNGGTQDYTFGRNSYKKINLIDDSISGLLNPVEFGALQGRSLPASLGSDTQFLVIDTMQQTPNNPYGDNANKYAVVSYRFSQAGRDAYSRHLGGVSVRALLPQESADQLLSVLQKNPDAIEEFYNGVAEGLEEGEKVRRIRSDRLAVIDLRNFPQEEREVLTELKSYLEGVIIAYERGGRIPRLSYPENNHGIEDPQASSGFMQISPEERIPQVDKQEAEGKLAFIMEKAREDLQVQRAAADRAQQARLSVRPSSPPTKSGLGALIKNWGTRNKR